MRSGAPKRSAGGAHGSGAGLAQAVQVRPRLASELDHVGEPLGRDQRGARGCGLRNSRSAFVATVIPCAKRSYLARLRPRGREHRVDRPTSPPSDCSGVLGTLAV